MKKTLAIILTAVMVLSMVITAIPFSASAEEEAVLDFSCDKTVIATGGSVVYGEKAMKYLHENINYPQISRDKNSQGRAFVSFIVNADGSIKDVEVLKSSGDIYR